jgi:hypothetical protein
MDLGSAPVLRSKKIQSRRKGETSRIGYSIATDVWTNSFLFGVSWPVWLAAAVRSFKIQTPEQTRNKVPAVPYGGCSGFIFLARILDRGVASAFALFVGWKMNRGWLG